MNKPSLGFAVTGSHCTLQRVLPVLKQLCESYQVLPIFSFTVAQTDTRFQASREFLQAVKAITGVEPVTTISQAEPIGPKALLDVLLVCPCTGNTLAKLAQGITDTPVTMACKAHMRNNRPLVLSISTNDGLGLNAQNLGRLLSVKNIFFVPFGQDDWEHKPNSLGADLSLVSETCRLSLEGRQLQPILRTFG